MLVFYLDLLNRFELKEDEVKYLASSGEIIIDEHTYDLVHVIDTFYETDFSVEAIEPLLKAIADKSKVDLYTVNFVFLTVASERMLEEYILKGYGETLFWETIMDIKYKLYECQWVKGVLGNHVIAWYPIFYRLDIVKLGRLEFEKVKFPKESYEKNGVSIKEGDDVYFIHIPSSGPLTEELRYDSYKRAYEFFSKEIGDGPLICICESWLLYEDNRKIFPSRLNIVKFLDDWDINYNEVNETNSEAWRIFGVDYSGDVSLLPRETTLQKSMIDWFEKGHKMGQAFGVLVFDGEKIINK